VERLALVCTSPGGTAPSYPLHRLEAMTEQERGALMLTLLDTRFTPEFLAAHPEHQQFLRMMAEHQRGAARLSADQQRGAREQLLARAGFDVIARLSRIGCPTLVASGAFDGIAPPENARLIADLVASAEYREYDGGHAFMVQDPRAVPEIIEFLAG
jgi:3-oxoadipate enol-lactonase